MTDEFVRDFHRHHRRAPGRKAHWCPDWDGMPVDEESPEFDGCVCDFAEEDS